MLRTHIVQVTHNLSDPGMEDALYDSGPVRRFCGFDAQGPIPDETTILNFRRRLEDHGLAGKIFQTINARLASKGVALSKGAIVDATIIDAPASTRNKAGKRDPEMHSTKKGGDWRFGMKAHSGIDAATGVVRSLVATPANEHDLNMARYLLTGKEDMVWGDAGYQGMEKREPGVEEREVLHRAAQGQRGAAGEGLGAGDSRETQVDGAGQGGAPVL